MIKIYQAGEIDGAWLQKRREQVAEADVDQAVAEIIDRVRQEGDEALFDYARRFDGAQLQELRVSQKEIDDAWENTEPRFREILTEAAENIREYHRSQLRQDMTLPKEDGIILGQRFTPIEKVGLYVPGGTAAYPSSVLMNAIPAALAGCGRIVMTTPPAADGTVNKDILAAAKVAGVTDIYKVGGAQAIAALAYGTQTIPAVFKIVGPGNIYVATAKKQVYGTVDIDMVAGPSEILVIADAAAPVPYLAADMLSQAEHDKKASALLICFSTEQAEAVRAELQKQLSLLPRREIAETSIEEHGAIIVAENEKQAFALSDAIAPEHLEIAMQDPMGKLAQVHNAGSIFLGYHTPEPLGDYWAGPNHVLPTLGLASCCGPLSVDDFIKRSSFICYTPEALSKAGEKIRFFAGREGLDAHGAAIAVRMEDK